VADARVANSATGWRCHCACTGTAAGANHGTATADETCAIVTG